MFCGSIYSGSSNANFDAGALPLNNIVKASDAECSTNNANNSISFLLNIAADQAVYGGTGGGAISCWNASITFIGTVYFNESYGSAIKLEDSCSIMLTGITYFYRNSAQSGGAILSDDSNIQFTGMAYFEGNVANHVGGALALKNSKLYSLHQISRSFSFQTMQMRQVVHSILKIINAL